MKKIVTWTIAIGLSLAFVLIPLPASDLFIRIYFDEVAGKSCVLYYATEEQDFLSEERCLISDIDYGQNCVEFRLDGSLDGHITDIRLDWPAQEQLLCVKTITVSSGGVIQKEYNPCTFFAEENIQLSNETSVTLVHPRGRAYLSTGADDPYQILSRALTAQIQGHYSHFRGSRLLICLFVAGSYFFAKKKIFT